MEEQTTALPLVINEEKTVSQNQTGEELSTVLDVFLEEVSQEEQIHKEGERLKKQKKKLKWNRKPKD